MSVGVHILFHFNIVVLFFPYVYIYLYIYIYLYNQRDATYTMFFIIINTLHVSGGFSAHR